MQPRHSLATNEAGRQDSLGLGFLSVADLKGGGREGGEGEDR